jgi:hypothetical protein
MDLSILDTSQQWDNPISDLCVQLRIMFSRLIHMAACIGMAEKYSIDCICFIDVQSSISGRFGCSQLLGITKSTTMKILA